MLRHASSFDGGFSPALEVALEYIHLNGWMDDDRHTLLTGRLVCRAWRTSRTFSSKITAVTLHSLADVQLAAALFPGTPCQRSPWQSVEESCAFPNLATLQVPGYLSLKLGESTSSLQLLASIKNIDIQLLEPSFELVDINNIGNILRVANIGRLSQLTLEGESDCLLEDLSALTDLRKLRLSDLPFQTAQELQSLGTLSQLKSLRHLQLDKEYFSEAIRQVEDIPHFLRSHFPLNQLSRLDFVDTCFSWDCGEIGGQVAPGVKDSFLSSDPFPGLRTDDLALNWVYASYSQGVLKLQRLEYMATVQPVDGNPWWVAPVSKVLACSASVSHLTIAWVPVAEVQFQSFVRLIFGDHREVPGFYIDVEGPATAGHGGMEGGSHRCDAERSHSALTKRPASFKFLSKDGVQVTASQFEILEHCDPTDVVRLAQQLPTLFPQLQSLVIRSIKVSDCSTFPFAEHLCHLTKLTLLKLTSSCASFPNFSIGVPTSLKDLYLLTCDLQGTLSSLSNLGHLTRLELAARSEVSNTASKGLNERHNCYDVRPLAGLRHLHSLIVSLPDTGCANLTGAETLTSLVSLKVMNASILLGGLRALGSMTQLRHLHYSLSVTYFERDDIMGTCCDVKKELLLKLPLSRIEILINDWEVQ